MSISRRFWRQGEEKTEAIKAVFDKNDEDYHHHHHQDTQMGFYNVIIMYWTTKDQKQK
jgi:ribosomal protein L32